jgi:hypothetical protein
MIYAQYLRLIRDGRDTIDQPDATLLRKAEQQARQKN